MARSAPASGAPRLLVILGPTGTGKSELALAVAEPLGGEIVGCDALQLYRGFDVGTAKPTPAQRRRTPHHLVDLIDPAEDASVALYVQLAERAIEAIHGRGRVPIVVGGTGLYLRGLLRGIVAAPPRNERLRVRLRAMAERRGPKRLHRWLASLDPESARRLAEGDAQRIVRALELALAGEATWSERLRAEGSWRTGVERFPNLKIGLDMPREALGRRLDDRVERFFAAGLTAEVRELRRRLPRGANAFKAIGYREVLRCLEQGNDPEEVRAEVCRNTRRYAKRQRSWFKREPEVHWLDARMGPSELADRAIALWRGLDDEGAGVTDGSEPPIA